MRVTKNQIIRGISDYIKSEILPKMGDDKAVQIIGTIAVNTAAANDRLLDSIFENEIVRALLEEDGSGTYEIGGLADAMRGAMDQYGSLSVAVPSIPFLTKGGITLRLNADDVDAMRRSIENA